MQNFLKGKHENQTDGLDYDDTFVQQAAEITIHFLQDLVTQAYHRNLRRDPYTRQLLSKDIIYLVKDIPKYKYKIANTILSKSKFDLISARKNKYHSIENLIGKEDKESEGSADDEKHDYSNLYE